MSKPGIRTHHQKEIRKARNESAEVGFCAIAPDFADIYSVSSFHFETHHFVRRLETGSDDQRVNVSLLAVFGEYPAFVDLLNAFGYHFYITSGKRRIIIVGNQNALAAHHIIRSKLVAEGFIGHALL